MTAVQYRSPEKKEASVKCTLSSYWVQHQSVEPDLEKMAKGKDGVAEKTSVLFTPPIASMSLPEQTHSCPAYTELNTAKMLPEVVTPIDQGFTGGAPLKLFINHQHQLSEGLGSPSLKPPVIVVPRTPAGQQATDGETDIHDSPGDLYHTNKPLFHIKTPQHEEEEPCTWADPSDVCPPITVNDVTPLNVNATGFARRHSSEINITEMIKTIDVEKELKYMEIENENVFVQDDITSEIHDVTSEHHDVTGPFLSTDGNRQICHPSEDVIMVRDTNGSYGFVPHNVIDDVPDNRYHDERRPSTHLEDSCKELDEKELSLPEQVTEDEGLKAEYLDEEEVPKVEYLGRGAYGVVYKYQEAGEWFVVKNTQIDQHDYVKEQVALNEVAILENLDHVNVVGFEYMYEEDQPDGTKHINIVLECMEGGSLESYLTRKGPLEEEEVISLMKPILKGMSYIHSQNVAHRDIKPDNLLLDGSYRNVKIADFGTAVKLKHPEEQVCEESFVGTPRYIAPEVCACTNHGLPADVWSLGATIVRMINGEKPYHELGAANDMAIIYKVGMKGVQPSITRQISDELSEVIDMCMRQQPEDRITVQQLLQLPIFQD